METLGIVSGACWGLSPETFRQSVEAIDAVSEASWGLPMEVLDGFAVEILWPVRETRSGLSTEALRTADRGTGGWLCNPLSTVGRSP